MYVLYTYSCNTFDMLLSPGLKSGEFTATGEVVYRHSGEVEAVFINYIILQKFIRIAQLL